MDKVSDGTTTLTVLNDAKDAPAAQEMQVSAEKRQALPNYRMS